MKEIQEGLNRGFYRKRRRCWSRFSFIPSTTVSSQDISANQSSDNSSQLSLISKSMSHEILQQTPPNSSSVGENKIFSKTNNKIARKVNISFLKNKYSLLLFSFKDNKILK